MLTEQEVLDSVSPHVQDLWIDACAVISDPSNDARWERFRSRCRPADIVMLIRCYAESQDQAARSDCDVPPRNPG